MKMKVIGLEKKCSEDHSLSLVFSNDRRTLISPKADATEHYALSKAFDPAPPQSPKLPSHIHWVPGYYSESGRWIDPTYICKNCNIEIRVDKEYR